MKNFMTAKILLPFGVLAIVGCASGFLKYEKSEQLKEIKEFDQAVKIETVEEAPVSGEASEGVPASLQKDPPATDTAATVVPVIASSPTPAALKKPVEKEKPGKKNKKGKSDSASSGKHEPDIEGQDGFLGRRPIKDPFRVGEKAIYEVSYMGVKAGDLVLAVKPYAQVNGLKSYHFEIELRTSPLFANFYEVDDKVVSLVDFESLVPSVFTLHVKETSQLREARLLHDHKTKTVSYWEKKVTQKDGPEEKKQRWEVPDYSQDVFSSAFYLRVFNWTVGKENAFRVADNEENLTFKGTALRKETLSTKVGTFPAIVVKPEVQLRGQFKPMGDIFIWLSDDDRHLILRIEAKIKIGTITAQITTLNKGHDESP